MECAFPELLAREDILRILQEERKICGIASLPDSELLRIFKTFAVPLTKRDARMGTQKPNPLKRIATDSVMDIDESLKSIKLMKYCHFDEVNAKICCCREKRPIDLDDNLDDDSLTSATKRIKITWP